MKRDPVDMPDGGGAPWDPVSWRGGSSAMERGTATPMGVLLVREAPEGGHVPAEIAILEEGGFRVTWARDRASALARLSADPTLALALVDLDLAVEWGGIDAARTLLAHRRLPVVFLADRGARDVLGGIRPIPHYGCVAKTAEPFALRSAVEKAWELFEAHERARRSEDALRESEERFRALFEESQDALMLIDVSSGAYVELNGAARDLFRFPNREKTLVVAPWGLSPEWQPDGRRSSEKAREMIARAHRTGVLAFEWMHRRWDGEPFPCAVLLHLLRGEGPPRLQATVRDISAEKRTEEKLRASEENFRTFFATADDMILVGNSRGRIVFANPAVSRKLGYRPEEIPTMAIPDLYPQDRRGAVEKILSSLPPGDHASCPVPLISVGGAFVPGETRFWRGTWDGQACVFVICKDLTAEQEAQQRFETLFRNNPAPMALSTLPDRRFSDVNEAFLSSLGFSRDEVIGRSGAELGLFVRTDQREALERQVRDSGRVALAELEIRGKDGRIIEGLFSGETLVSQGRRYLLMVMIDITERKESARRLAEERRRLESILRGTRAGTWEWYVQTGETVFNDRWAEIVGYTLEELAPTTIATWERLGHPEDLQTSARLLEKHFSRELPFYDCQVRMRHKDGHWVWVHDRGTVVSWTEDGKPELMSGTHMDVSAAREAEDALRAKTEELDRYFTASLDLLCIADTEGRFLRLNPQWEKVLGYPLHELEGTRFLDLVHPDDLEGTLDALARLGAQEEVLSFENRYRCRDGTYRWIEWRSIPQGRTIYAAARDVTDRKRAEDALRMHSRMQEILMDISSTYINLPLENVSATIQRSLGELALFVDADRVYVFDYDFERGICTNTYEWCGGGIKPQIEVLQVVPLELIPDWVEAHGRGEAVYIADVRSLPPGKMRDTLELQDIKSLLTVPMLHRDRCVGFVGFDAVRRRHLFSDNERRLLSIFAQMLANIRQRQQIEAELRQTNRRLEESTVLANEMAVRAEAANLAKGAFLANMSHEIRTPMNAILGLIQLALGNARDSRQREYLSKIDRSSRMLLGILNDILDYSKIDAGRLVLEDLSFRSEDPLETLVDMFLPRAEEKGLEFRVVRSPALPPVLRGDPLRLQQVLANLLSNAIKFTDGGSVVLEVAPGPDLPEDPGRVAVRFSVRDTGMGVAPEVREAIFAPFAQGDSSTTRRFGGTGLGLAISRRLVEMMGGVLELESTPGQGSTFAFTLALKRGVPGGAERAVPDEPSGTATLRGMRLLVAEDHPLNRQVVVELLERLGAVVRGVGNGREAVAAAGEERFDAVLLDLQMPEMDGLEAARIIRAAQPDLALVALTASVLPQDRQASLAAGMNEHLSKPVDVTVLSRTLARWLPGGAVSRPREARERGAEEETLLPPRDRSGVLPLLQTLIRRLERSELVEEPLWQALLRALEGCPEADALAGLGQSLEAFDYDRGLARARELLARVAGASGSGMPESGGTEGSP